MILSARLVISLFVCIENVTIGLNLLYVDYNMDQVAVLVKNGSLLYADRVKPCTLLE